MHWQLRPANSEEADLLEAVFRYEIEHYTSGVPRAGSTRSVYISLGEHKDPPPDVLARFKDHVPPVEPVSRAAGEDGMTFRATHIKWIDNETVDIEGGYDCGDLLCGSGVTYRLQRKAGTWTVVSDGMNWIS
jgi:hypothetical protein